LSPSSSCSLRVATTVPTTRASSIDGLESAASRRARDTRADGSNSTVSALRPTSRAGAAPRVKCTPSIHMPRWASRLSLDVVSVGVERLHDIDDEGATREGIQWWSKDGALRKYAPADDEGDGPMWPWRDCPRSPREAFERLWTEVYGAPSWAMNPWVWRVEFTRVEGGR